MSREAGPLADTPRRDYARKLQLFNAFAEPELREAIGCCGLRPGMRVLDAGCGTGAALDWLAETVGPTGCVVGMDLSEPHARAARSVAPAQALVIQADLMLPPLARHSFDLVWAVNTINHVHDPVAAAVTLARLLRKGGRIVLGQSSLVPDMYFAWDGRLERMVNEAVRSHYRDRYGLSERDLAGVRALTGILRQARLRQVAVRTVVIERISPLGAADEAYLLEALFRGTWGERLRPYLAAEDYAALERLCDPSDPHYAPRRPDFHLLQTLTLASGEV